MKKSIYREEVLEKLSSPERLNEMVKITTSKSWLSLIALFLIVIGGLAWGIWGSIPRRVIGKGIIIQSGGVIEVSAMAIGKVERIVFKDGDIVNEGDIIAYIAQPEIAIQIENLEKRLAEMRERYTGMASFEEKDFKLTQDLLMKKKEIQEQTISTNSERVEFLQEQISSQEELLTEGLITRETLNRTQMSYFQLLQENDKLRNELKAINIDLLEISNRNENTLSNIEESIIDMEGELNELKAKYEISSVVKSPYRGRVVEVVTNPGELIRVGSHILSIEVMGITAELEAIVYVPPSAGKKVEAGMEVMISPSTVEKEEYGFILGKVRQVSEYPASKEGMTRILGNTDLVESFSKGVPPIAIYVKLYKNPHNPSGFAWTSATGPETQIRSGTLCESHVIVERQTPISLLFPAIKKVGNL